MSPARQADPELELDSLIGEITVDCHDEYEQLTGFKAALDEDASFPCPGTIIGEDVDVLSVSTSSSRREPGTDRRVSTRRPALRDRSARHRTPRRPDHLTPASRISPLGR
jgi:hypothetical protein